MSRAAEKVKRNLRRLTKTIDMRTPTGWGFCLLVFPFNKIDKAQYASNAKREDMPAVLRGFADHLEGKA